MDSSLKSTERLDAIFPVHINCCEHHAPGPIFGQHWHPEIQLLRFRQGTAMVQCSAGSLPVTPSTLVVINGNELHYGESLSASVVYDVIKIDFSFLLSNQVDLCQTKYIMPLLQNRILFRNIIADDLRLFTAVDNIIREHREQQTGFELAIKAYAYEILVTLLRSYVAKNLNESEYARQLQTMHRLQTVLEFVETNFTEAIPLSTLSGMAVMSPHHFCRLFKKITGKTAGDYINHKRINKAVDLLTDRNLNVTEIALATGFNDVNYFSRVFKKYKGVSPSTYTVLT